MLREAGARHTIQALHVLIASGLFVFAFVTQSSDSIAALVYLSIGIPVALIVAFGLSLVGSSGMKVRVVGCALVAYMAMSGWFAALPIAVPGGTLWWLLLLAVALVGAVSPWRTAQPVVEARTIRGMPRLREAVVGAQAVLAVCVVGVLMIALSNAHGISGIGLPILLVPFTAVVVAGIAYQRAVRWPVVLVNVPLFLFAFLAAREELASPE
jgi:hypothetical protein